MDIIVEGDATQCLESEGTIGVHKDAVHSLLETQKQNLDRKIFIGASWYSFLAQNGLKLAWHGQR